MKFPDEETTGITTDITSSHVTAEHIAKAGVQALMYGGKENDALNCLRHAKFMEMIICRWIPKASTTSLCEGCCLCASEEAYDDTMALETQGVKLIF